MFDTDFWSNLVSSLIGVGVGAFLAFALERYRRSAEQHRHEVGQCHQLACLLLNRLNVLQDFHEFLFLSFEQRNGQPPTWDQVPALDGAPDQTDDIPMGDYTFLIDGREHQSNAPSLLRRVQLSTINTNILFARLARRNQLWHEREGGSILMTRGDAGAEAMGLRMTLDRSLEELTSWLRQDFGEEIQALEQIFDLFYQVMRDRYPTEKILHFRPTAGGPPLGHAGGATAPPPSTPSARSAG